MEPLEFMRTSYPFNGGKGSQEAPQSTQSGQYDVQGWWL